MIFGRKRTDDEGWSAVVSGPARISLAKVVRHTDARPIVQACEHYAVEKEAPLAALQQLRGALRSARCTTLLDHGQYQLLQIDTPGNATEIPRDELRDALRWRVKEMVDFPVEAAGIDMLDIPATGGGRTRQCWVVIASHAVLQPRIRLFQDAKLDLAAIDIPELAQRNLAALFEEENRGLALLAFDEEGGRLTITFQGELFVARRIDISASELLAADAENLHERALLDIQRTLDNFDRNFSAISLPRLRIAPLPGGDAFIDYLASNLSLPVARADLAEVLDIAAVPALAETAFQATSWLALGAALREA